MRHLYEFGNEKSGRAACGFWPITECCTGVIEQTTCYECLQIELRRWAAANKTGAELLAAAEAVVAELDIIRKSPRCAESVKVHPITHEALRTAIAAARKEKP